MHGGSAHWFAYVAHVPQGRFRRDMLITAPSDLLETTLRLCWLLSSSAQSLISAGPTFCLTALRQMLQAFRSRLSTSPERGKGVVALRDIQVLQLPLTVLFCLTRADLSSKAS